MPSFTSFALRQRSYLWWWQRRRITVARWFIWCAGRASVCLFVSTSCSYHPPESNSHRPCARHRRVGGEPLHGWFPKGCQRSCCALSLTASPAVRRGVSGRPSGAASGRTTGSIGCVACGGQHQLITPHAGRTSGRRVDCFFGVPVCSLCRPAARGERRPPRPGCSRGASRREGVKYSLYFTIDQPASFSAAPLAALAAVSVSSACVRLSRSEASSSSSSGSWAAGVAR